MPPSPAGAGSRGIAIVRPGSHAAAWNAAAASMSSMAGSSAGLDTLSTATPGSGRAGQQERLVALAAQALRARRLDAERGQADLGGLGGARRPAPVPAARHRCRRTRRSRAPPAAGLVPDPDGPDDTGRMPWPPGQGPHRGPRELTWLTELPGGVGVLVPDRAGITGAEDDRRVVVPRSTGTGDYYGSGRSEPTRGLAVLASAAVAAWAAAPQVHRPAAKIPATSRPAILRPFPSAPFH